MCAGLGGENGHNVTEKWLIHLFSKHIPRTNLLLGIMLMEREETRVSGSLAVGPCFTHHFHWLIGLFPAQGWSFHLSAAAKDPFLCRGPSLSLCLCLCGRWE